RPAAATPRTGPGVDRGRRMMIRTVATLLLVTALGGCYVISRGPYEPPDDARSQPVARSTTAWRQPNGVPAQAQADATAASESRPMGPLRIVATRVVGKRSAAEAQPTATETVDSAGGDGVDSSLVQNTWTQAPGNRSQVVKSEGDTAAGFPPTVVT